MATVHQDRGTGPRETEQHRSSPETPVLQILAFVSAMLATIVFAFWSFVNFLALAFGDEGSTPGQLGDDLLLAAVAALGMLTAALLIVGHKLPGSMVLSAAGAVAGFSLWMREPPTGQSPAVDLLLFFVGPSLVALGLCIWLRRRPDWPTSR